MRTKPAFSSLRGQTMVILAVGMVALVGMVGVVIDVGMQWADNRASQNGSDAAAEAGAIVLLRRMADPAVGLGDTEVRLAVQRAADVNDIEVEDAEYTDYQGNLLGAKVGGGSIPANAQGVRVVGTRVHETVFARVVGVNELSVFTDAIAVAGPADPCPAGSPCVLLPVTFPTTEVGCASPMKSEPTEIEWSVSPNEVTVPLCGNNPGSIGWIDWTPPPSAGGGGGGGGHSGPGGTAELAAEICDPDPDDIELPGWFYVTSAGNPNASTIQNCFEKWIGKDLIIPLFQATCRTKPASGAVCDDDAPIGGVNQWYYFPHYVAFHLTGVYIQGSHTAICGTAGVSCLTGMFVDVAITGTVGEYLGPSDGLTQFLAVQLIH